MRIPDRAPAIRLLIAVVLLALAVPAAGVTRVRVTSFSGSSDWPLFVGKAQGFFDRAGLEIDLSTTRSSAAQLRSLLAGDIDIALTAMDNVIAFDARDDAAGLVAVMGVNRGGRARLIARRDVHTPAELRGRVLAVDAVDTGYAFVLMEILRRGGVAPGDYTLLAAGGSPDRLAALQDGRAAAALLNAPVDAQAEAQGFTVLASASDVLARYQGSVGAVRREWAREHRDVVIAFIRAYVGAVDWLADPSHRDAAIAILLDRMPSLTTQQAARSYAELLDPASGTLSPRAAIDIQGVRAVLDLRARYGAGVHAVEPDPYRYYDPSYYQRAIAHE